MTISPASISRLTGLFITVAVPAAALTSKALLVAGSLVAPVKIDSAVTAPVAAFIPSVAVVTAGCVVSGVPTVAAVIGAGVAAVAALPTSAVVPP